MPWLLTFISVFIFEGFCVRFWVLFSLKVMHLGLVKLGIFKEFIEKLFNFCELQFEHFVLFASFLIKNITHLST